METKLYKKRADALGVGEEFYDLEPNSGRRWVRTALNALPNNSQPCYSKHDHAVANFGESQQVMSVKP